MRPIRMLHTRKYKPSVQSVSQSVSCSHATGSILSAGTGVLDKVDYVGRNGRFPINTMRPIRLLHTRKYKPSVQSVSQSVSQLFTSNMAPYGPRWRTCHEQFGGLGPKRPRRRGPQAPRRGPGAPQSPPTEQRIKHGVLIRCPEGPTEVPQRGPAVPQRGRSRLYL